MIVHYTVNTQKVRPMYAAARHDPTAAIGVRFPATRFTALEERVLRLAATGSERPSSTVEPAIRRWSRRIANVVMAQRGGRELADPRLEALRSYAASVRLGRSDGLPVFYAAGYSAAHAAEVKRFVDAAGRAARAHPHARRESFMYASGIGLGLASLLGFVGMTGTLLVGL